MVSPFESPQPDNDRDDLSICPNEECGNRFLVYPVEWEEVGDQEYSTCWEVLCRCPNCEWTGLGIHTLEKVERFDYALDMGTEILDRDYRRLVNANMKEEAERFIYALERNAIMPEDFGRIALS